MRRHLNKRLLAILAVVGILLGAGIYVLHGVQVRRSARVLLKLSAQAEAEGDRARAAQHLERYLTYRPQDGEALVKFAMLLKELAQTRTGRERALQALQKAALARPDRQDVRREVARVALGLGRFADAKEALDALTKATPDDSELEQFQGQCAAGLKENDEAAQSYRKSIAHDPKRIDAYVLLAVLVRTRLDDPEEADRVIDQMVAANGDSARAHLERWQYRTLFHPPADPADVDRALQLAPDDADVLLAAADAARLGGDFERARGRLQHGLERSGQDVRLHRALAALELQAGRPAEAAAALNRAITAIPGQADALRLDLADALIQGGRPDEAQQVIGQLRKARGPSPTLDLIEARARLARRDASGAIRLLETARARLTSQATPTPEADQIRKQLLVQADLLLGQCYEQAGAADLELSAFRRVLEIEPRSLPARVGVAAALAASGRVAPALEAYEAIAAEAPEYRIVVARLALLKALQTPAGQRSWSDVDRALDRAAQAAPDSVEVPALRAEALAAQGQIERARTLVEEARDRHPDRSEPWIALAGLAERQPQTGPDAALALLDQAQQRLGDRVDLRLARARAWARRGGDAARQALAPLADGIEAFSAADQARLLDGLAGASAQAGDVPRATQLWGRLVALRPNDPGLRALLFDLALQQGDEAGMQQAVQELRAIEGDDGTLWRFGQAALQVARARKGNKQGLDEARTRLAEVARRRPDWPRVPLLAAELAELEATDAGRDRAIEGYRRAIAQGEPGTQAIQQLVRLLYQRGRLRNRPADLQEADRLLRRLPTPAPLAGTLGQIAADLSLRNKDFGRALELAQQAVPADSADPRDRIWLAGVQTASGKPDQALETLRQAARDAGGEPEVWIALVRHLALTMGRKADAEAAVQEAQAKLPPDRAPAALAQCYVAIGQLDRAETLYGEAVAARPDDADLRAQAAAFYLRTLRPLKAEPHLRRILEPSLQASPEALASARRNLAIVLADQGTTAQFREAQGLIEQNLRDGGAAEDLRVQATVLATRPEGRRDAIAAFAELARRQPPTPNDQFLLARLHFEDGRRPKALELLRTLLARHDDEPAYLATYIDWLLPPERPDAAAAAPWLEKLERLQPKAYLTRELKARMLRARGQPDAAVALLKAGLPEPGAPAARIAALLDGWGRDADAEAVYRALADRVLLAAEDQPTRPAEALLLADFLARKGRLDEALDACDRAAARCPPDAIDTIGGTYLALLAAAPADEAANRRVDRALDEAIRAHPKSRMLPVHRAVLRCRQGRYDEAEAIYRQLIQRDPRHVAALNNLALLLAQRRRNGDEALRLIDAAIQQFGSRATLLDTRALALLALGRTDEAIRDLKQALEQTPDGTGYFHLARAYQQANDPAAAAEAFREARARGVRPDPLEQQAYDQLLAQVGP